MAEEERTLETKQSYHYSRSPADVTRLVKLLIINVSGRTRSHSAKESNRTMIIVVSFVARAFCALCSCLEIYPELVTVALNSRVSNRLKLLKALVIPGLVKWKISIWNVYGSKFPLIQNLKKIIFTSIFKNKYPYLNLNYLLLKFCTVLYFCQKSHWKNQTYFKEITNVEVHGKRFYN